MIHNLIISTPHNSNKFYIALPRFIIMALKETMRAARQLATPSKYEKATIELAVNIILKRLNLALKKKFIKAKTECGGSFAKETWLPGSTDIDCFVRFNYRRYKNKSSILADILEPAIASAFSNYKRLHGSRDYFQIAYDRYIFEFVPVLRVKKPAKAANITDVSPLHVAWVKKKNLSAQIRLAKLFFKAAGVYGAESYIRGFSGHVTEILIIKYKSFVKLAKASQKWNKKTYIDPEKHYSNKQIASRKLNKSKTLAPLLVIDPIQSERNAAAALNYEQFKKLIEQFKKFLKNPNLKFFKQTGITIKNLKVKAKNKTLIILTGSPQHDKQDVAGAKLLKQFEKITSALKEHEFTIIQKGWQWRSLDESALFWFYLNPKKLPETRKHLGPPIKSAKERVESFIKKYGKNALRDKKTLYVILKRKYRTPEKLIESLLGDDEFSNIELIK